MVAKNVRATIMLYTDTLPGNTSAHRVFSMPKPLISRYVGINPPPKNMVTMKIPMSGFFSFRPRWESP